MSLRANADQILSQACAVGDVPGVIAMATDRNGTIYEGAFGVRTLGAPRPMTIDTVVWIASMTKAITGAAAMQLVEQGKLDLDKPGGTWMPELAQAQVLEGFGSAFFGSVSHRASAARRSFRSDIRTAAARAARRD